MFISEQAIGNRQENGASRVGETQKIL